MATRASMSASAFAACQAARRTARRHRPAWCRRGSRPRWRGRSTSSLVEARAQQALHGRAGLGVFAGAERLHRRRPGARGRCRRDRLPRRLGHGVAERAQRGRPPPPAPSSRDRGRAPTAPARNSGPSIAASAVNAAARIVGDGSPSRSSRRSVGGRGLEGAERGHDLDVQRRIERRLVEQRQQRRTARASPRRPRPRTACRRTAGCGVGDGEHVEQRRHGDRRLLRQAEAPRGKRGAVEPVALEQQLMRRQRRADPRSAAARRRPATTRCAAGPRRRGRRQQHVVAP